MKNKYYVKVKIFFIRVIKKNPRIYCGTLILMSSQSITIKRKIAISACYTILFGLYALKFDNVVTDKDFEI